MDNQFVIRTIVGHVARLLTPAAMWLATHLGLEAAQAQGWATEAASAAAGLAGVALSAWWSYRSRKKLAASGQTPATEAHRSQRD